MRYIYRLTMWAFGRYAWSYDCAVAMQDHGENPIRYRLYMWALLSYYFPKD